MKIKKIHFAAMACACSAALTLTLGGCALFGTPKKVAVRIPEKFKYSVKTASGKKAPSNRWWEGFGDTELNKLINEASKNNLNYLIAVKNIQIAQTYVSQSESSYFPTISLNAQSTRSKMPGYQTAVFSGNTEKFPTVIYSLNQASLSASYQLDVWNQVNNAVKQAQASVEVSKEDAAVVKLTLISDLSQAYLQWAALNESIADLKKQLKAQKEILALDKVQYSDGIIDEEPVENARTAIVNIKAGLDSAEKMKETAVNAIAYYLGKFPEKFRMQEKRPEINDISGFNYGKLVPEGIPSTILTRRPDVKAAEYAVLSSAYAKKESLANFFPVISLTGNYGFASFSLSNLIQDTNSFWDFGLSLVEPIFNYKQNSSIYKRSKLQYKEAVLNYRNIVINAFTETDDALVNYKKDTNTLRGLENNLKSAKRLCGIYKVQYKTGIISRAAYLEYKINMLNARYNLINGNLLLQEDLISIYNAMGMGL